MSNKLESLKSKIIGAIKGEDDFEKEFVHFWDDADQTDDDIADQIKDGRSSLSENIVETLQITSVILLLISILITIIGNRNNSLFIQIVITFLLIISTYKIQKNYRTPLDLLEKSISKIQRMDLSENSELMFYHNLPEIVTNMEELRREFVGMRNTLDQISQEMNNHTFTTAQTLSTVESSLVSMNDSIELGGLGTSNYHESKFYISEITKEFDNFAATFDDALETNTELISLLRSIGKQINMLALNAGIEAARAGKKGIGFEVLSTNLQRLSQHTITTTNEMKKIKNKLGTDSKSYIENVISSVNLLQSKIDSSHSTVGSITSEIYHTNQNIKKLISDLQNLEDLSLSISQELELVKTED